MLHRRTNRTGATGRQVQVRPRAVAAAVAAALIGGIAPALLNAGGLHTSGGKAVAGALVIAGLAAVAGLALARTIGRQGKV